MIIKEIQDINTIIPLHAEIFGKAFPIPSYYKKCKTNKLYIFVYEEDSDLIGYSIIVDQNQEKNMYAWYGGVLPKFQGKGITQIFFENLIELAREKNYLSVTVASSNIRPHMLILAIKMGFDIYELKKREGGEGNKIYFKYKLFPLHTEIILLEENGRRLKPVEIEEKLVRAYKNNSTSIKFDYTGNSDALIYALKYCNSFSKRPKILIETDRDIQASELSKAIQQYEGDVEIIKK